MIERTEPRVAAEFPVDLGAAQGMTRNVCPSGVYFETNASFMDGSAISFSIDLDSPGGRLTLKCQGTIVRVEKLDEKFGVAVKITESVMSAKDVSTKELSARGEPGNAPVFSQQVENF